jgi:hypothetical protein
MPTVANGEAARTPFSEELAASLIKLTVYQASAKCLINATCTI